MKTQCVKLAAPTHQNAALLQWTLSRGFIHCVGTATPMRKLLPQERLWLVVVGSPKWKMYSSTDQIHSRLLTPRSGDSTVHSQAVWVRIKG